ncbi:MAG: hypothetical protein ACR2JV_01945 [Gaiellales bacterium]
MTIPEALDEVVSVLRDAGLTRATRDAGAFFPSPIGVLVGMPSLTSTGLGARTLEVPVHVISADPPSPRILGLMYAAADTAAAALSIDKYQPGTYSGNVNAEPLPTIDMTAVVTIPYTSPAPEE